MATWLNDTHSTLNRTQVLGVTTPETPEAVAGAVRSVPHLSVGGSRHAMGGQQFATDALHLDLRRLNRVRALDAERGLVTAEAGIQWPELIAAIRAMNEVSQPQWGIRQKQTGASDLTLGGALSANAHGRGLAMRPFVDDVESFELIDANGELRRCSRNENIELFAHAIGGYGLFGVITAVTLHLSPRRKVARIVDVIETHEVVHRFRDEAADGTIYGDYQFDIDHASPTFLRRGVFSRYRPVDAATPIPPNQRLFTPDLWLELLRLARTNKAEAFERYVEFYRSTSGQIYHTDTHQLSTYIPRYHEKLADLPPDAQGTEVITELYVAPDRFEAFMAAAAEALRASGASVTYGTVRTILADRETALPWARHDSMCVIFNVLTKDTPQGLEHSQQVFRDLIDVAIGFGGSFFLTYHRHATRAQLEACHPNINVFVDAKRRLDPGGRFGSDWFTHIATLLAGSA